MRIYFTDNKYYVQLDQLEVVTQIPTNNIVEAKNAFLTMLSERFDRAISEALSIKHEEPVIEKVIEEEE